MDLSESMQIVSSRIQEVEPELSLKIIGYLLLQDFGDRCIIRLAFSPDDIIRNVAGKVKHIINLLNQQQQLQQLQQQMAFASVSHPLNNPLQYCNPYRGFPDFQPCSNPNMPLTASWNVQGANGLEEQFQRSLTFEDDYSNSELHSSYGYPDQPGFAADKVSKRLRNLSEFPPKVCHYFIKGGCKHGNNCRFFHGNPMALESFSELLGHGSSDIGYRNRNLIDDHSMFPVGSLEKLELDLIELLRSNGGPISISTLPMMYYEKYGRTLQAEGYLTESQRHGKVGYSLTRLLARLKNSISVIDRPHGQHSVILAEGAPKYLEYPSDDRSEKGVIVPGSRQMYLTFPAESEFSETDVSNYFNTYGPVQDVRIPSQEKRMFGFVTFVYPETVTKILAKANPHFVSGARVLVKPYREKSRLVDRKHAEKLQHCMHNDSHVFDGDPEFQFLPRASDYSRLMRQQFMEERKEALEQEITSLSESQLLPKPSARLQYFANSIDELKLAQEFPTWEQSDYSRLSNLNIGSSSEETFRYMNTTYDTQESNGVLNLPDNPFATSTSYDT